MGLGRRVWRTRRRQGWHKLRRNGEIVFQIRVEKCHWAAFGVSAERLPGDNEPDLERALCVGGGVVRNKGLLENVQLARGCGFHLRLRHIKVGPDGDSDGAIRKHASPERVQTRFQIGVPSMDM